MKRLLTGFTALMMILITAANTGSATPVSPVPGKIFFSNQPFTNSNAGSKKMFTSHEYLYGRFELSGATIKEAFKLKEAEDAYPFLQYELTLLRGGEEIGSNGITYMMLKEDDKAAGSFNFDIMPDPLKATTVYSILDDFSAGYGFSPMHGLIINKRLKEGKYQVRIKIYSRAVDGWGKELEMDKWPALEEEFDFEFMESDIEKVNNDYDKITEVIKENAFRYDKLPDVFYNSANITDPKATNAKILAIIKRDLPERMILKLAIEKTGTLWSIATGDLGLPTYRYFYPGVYVAYKKDGKCYVGRVTLRQTYMGGGTYGPLQVGYTSASGQRDKGIDCMKVK